MLSRRQLLASASAMTVYAVVGPAWAACGVPTDGTGTRALRVADVLTFGVNCFPGPSSQDGAPNGSTSSSGYATGFNNIVGTSNLRFYPRMYVQGTDGAALATWANGVSSLVPNLNWIVCLGYGGPAPSQLITCVENIQTAGYNVIAEGNNEPDPAGNYPMPIATVMSNSQSLFTTLSILTTPIKCMTPSMVWDGGGGATAFTSYVTGAFSAFNGYIAATVMTASTMATNSPSAIASGMTVLGGPGVSVTASTTISSLGSGTGGTGTYNVNNSQTVGSSGSPVQLYTANGNMLTLNGYVQAVSSHMYPNNGYPSHDMDHNTIDYSEAFDYKPLFITEFHPLYFNGSGPFNFTSATYSSAYNVSSTNFQQVGAYFTLVNVLIGAKNYGLNATVYFDMYDYVGFPRSTGLFSGQSPTTPYPTGTLMACAYGLCSEAGAATVTRDSFPPGQLNVSVTGLPGPVDGSHLESGGQYLVVQKSSGHFGLWIWNEQQVGALDMTTSPTTVTVTFGTAKTKAVGTGLLGGAGTISITTTGTALATYNNVTSFTTSLYKTDIQYWDITF